MAFTFNHGFVFYTTAIMAGVGLGLTIGCGLGLVFGEPPRGPWGLTLLLGVALAVAGTLWMWA